MAHAPKRPFPLWMLILWAAVFTPMAVYSYVAALILGDWAADAILTKAFVVDGGPWVDLVPLWWSFMYILVSTGLLVLGLAFGVVKPLWQATKHK